MQNKPTFPEETLHPLVTFVLMWLAQNGAFLLLAWMIFYHGFTLIPTLLLIFLAASWWTLYQTA